MSGVITRLKKDQVNIACSCEVKKPILEYLDLTKRQLLELNAKPWTDLELVLLVVTSLLGAIGLFTGVPCYSCHNVLEKQR